MKQYYPIRQPALSVEEAWSPANFQSVVDSWSLTEKEQARLRDLQRRLSDIKHWKNDPLTVLKFMVAPWGYEEAEMKFRAMIDWRLQNNVDTILQEYEPPLVLLENTPNTVLQDYDHDGDPIFLERGGQLDVQQGLKEFGKEALLQHAIWTRELITRGVWTEQYEQRQQRHVKGVTCIYDLQGLSASKHLDKHVIQVFRETFALIKTYYPGKVKRIFIIRAPPIFRILWNMVSHFFRPQLREKMIFCGKNYVKTLNQYMDAQRVLPACIVPGGRGRSANGLPPVVGSSASTGTYVGPKVDNRNESLPDLAASSSLSSSSSSCLDFPSKAFTDTETEDDTSSTTLLDDTSICTDSGISSASNIGNGYWVDHDDERQELVVVVSE